MTTETICHQLGCSSGTWTACVLGEMGTFLSCQHNNNDNNIELLLPATARHYRQPVEQKALDAMMDYLHEYLRQVDEAEPREGDGPLEKIAAGHADYSNYR